MKKVFLIFFIFLVIVEAKAEDVLKFIPYLTDVPLYDKVELYDDSLIEFDSAWGSIVEIDGKCYCSCKTLNKYYEFIMPNLGWNKDDKSYIRDSLTLNISTNQTDSGCEINFSETH